jgi:hypothetical protein
MTKRKDTKANYVSDNDLIPLAHPKKIGLPFSRRVLGRRIFEGRFVPVVKINGRLFVTRQNLENYKLHLATAALDSTSEAVGASPRHKNNETLRKAYEVLQSLGI